MVCGLLGRELSSQFSLTIKNCFKENSEFKIVTGYKKNYLRIWQKIAERAGGF